MTNTSLPASMYLDHLLERIGEDLEHWRRMYEATRDNDDDRDRVVNQYIQLALARFPSERSASGRPTDWLVQLYCLHQLAIRGELPLDVAVKRTVTLMLLEGAEVVLPEVVDALRLEDDKTE